MHGWGHIVSPSSEVSLLFAGQWLPSGGRCLACCPCSKIQDGGGGHLEKSKNLNFFLISSQPID